MSDISRCMFLRTVHQMKSNPEFLSLHTALQKALTIQIFFQNKPCILVWKSGALGKHEMRNNDWKFYTGQPTKTIFDIFVVREKVWLRYKFRFLKRNSNISLSWVEVLLHLKGTTCYEKRCLSARGTIGTVIVSEQGWSIGNWLKKRTSEIAVSFLSRIVEIEE